jgi:hypothetical protein
VLAKASVTRPVDWVAAPKGGPAGRSMSIYGSARVESRLMLTVCRVASQRFNVPSRSANTDVQLGTKRRCSIVDCDPVMRSLRYRLCRHMVKLIVPSGYVASFLSVPLRRCVRQAIHIYVMLGEVAMCIGVVSSRTARPPALRLRSVGSPMQVPNAGGKPKGAVGLTNSQPRQSPSWPRLYKHQGSV